MEIRRNAGIIITNNNRAQSGGRYLSDNGLTEKSAAVHTAQSGRFADGEQQKP